MPNTAVVLLNLGGPDNLDAVEPFLFNLFSDPDIFRIPLFQKSLAKIISRRRSPKIRRSYAAIGGSSPINHWTEVQRRALEDTLNGHGSRSAQGPDSARPAGAINISGQAFKVFTAMRYWKPSIASVAERLSKDEFGQIILLPLYPHFCRATTGSSYNEWDRHFTGDAGKVSRIQHFPTHPTYLSAINERIDQALATFDEGSRAQVRLLFSAHGIPVSFVKRGDPYRDQVEQTVGALMAHGNRKEMYHLAYQSKVGPVKWLEPATDQMIRQLGGSGVKDLVVIPISFVSDHIETLYELDIEYRETAEEAGMSKYVVTEGLNDSGLFVMALADLVKMVAS